MTARYWAAWHEGHEDARNSLPRRLGQCAGYRAGYDRGLSEFLLAVRVTA